MKTDQHKKGFPLYIRILIGIALGTVCGVALQEKAAPLGELGMLVIRLLKALATPLILFAVLDAFLRIRIPGKKGLLLICLSLVNACVAILIGLGVAHLIHGGDSWIG